VETSSRNSLTVLPTAQVHTGAPAGVAGTWLLDPADVTIAAAGGTITPDSITGALADNNVVVFTDPNTAGATGAITVNSAVLYNSANSLSLLAMGGITVNASVQNDGSGALGLIAGWDGKTTPTGIALTTPPQQNVPSATAVDLSPILATPGTTFGLAGGDVTIGGNGASGDVAVGTA